MARATIYVDEWPDMVDAEIERRAHIFALLEHDPIAQANMCALMFSEPRVFFDLFAWTYDPRAVGGKNIPLLGLEFQWFLFAAFVGELWLQDGLPAPLAVYKSRDMGATEIVLAAILFVWLFRPGCDIGIISKEGWSVDNKTAKSLFGRIRKKIASLPKWLRPPGHPPAKARSSVDKLRCLVNPLNDNVIIGSTATEDPFRGDRLWRVAVDESAMIPFDDRVFDAISQVTESPLHMSTPNGSGGEFAGLVRGDTSPIHEVQRHDGGDPAYLREGGGWNYVGELVEPPEGFKGYLGFKWHYNLDARKGDTWRDRQDVKYNGKPAARARELEIGFEASQRGRCWPEFEKTIHVIDTSIYRDHIAGAIFGTRRNQGWDHGARSGYTVRVSVAHFPPTKKNLKDGNKIGLLVVTDYWVDIRPRPEEIEAAETAAGWHTGLNPSGEKPSSRVCDQYALHGGATGLSWMRLLAPFGISWRPVRKDPLYAVELLRSLWIRKILRLAPACAVRQGHHKSLADACAALSYLEPRGNVAPEGYKAKLSRTWPIHYCDALMIAVMDALGDPGIQYVIPSIDPSEPARYL